jgi:hypothetical protein
MTDMFAIVEKLRSADKPDDPIPQHCVLAAEEVFQERSAICEYDGLLTREQAEAQGLLASREWLEVCEIRHALTMNSYDWQEHLAAVTKARGKPAAEALREKVRAEYVEQHRRNAA